ncbi:peroxidase A2 [Cajanus cajan]|uniref:peroxidase A2 n=1 Tax=Cajanus cajan TaxID=3821 RepID=UPI00098D7DDA|nr:peroxidase A2 [Cajanus cajan]
MRSENKLSEDSRTTKMGLMRVVVVAVWCAVFVMHAEFPVSNGELSSTFYNETCPLLYDTVYGVIYDASLTDTRIGASLIRLHFHDCFVQGCDASVLLNNTATIESEQDATPNNNSLRGLDVVNNIKTALENICPATVSCADILAIAAEVGSALGGGPSWSVLLGRRDSLTANRTLANLNLPAPSSTVDELIENFANQGLNTTDLVALSGAHTFGRATCSTFDDRLYDFNGTGSPDPTLDTTYLELLSEICPQDATVDNLTNLDLTTPNEFDNKYYSNLQNLNGLLQSDQELFSTSDADTIALVNSFSSDQSVFFANFIVSMIKMGDIGVLEGDEGQIRLQCNFVNGDSSGLVGGVTAKDPKYKIVAQSK